MLKISVERGVGATVEMKGCMLEILNDALNVVGQLSKRLEEIGGEKVTAMFVAGIPTAIIKYRNDKKEEQHENDVV